jgi:hypothetical protein
VKNQPDAQSTARRAFFCASERIDRREFAVRFLRLAALLALPAPRPAAAAAGAAAATVEAALYDVTVLSARPAMK